ncbi:MAG TPA: hypothetical protein VKR53_01415 [Puia sp.]|nr:hypothetical protein [Puia sp.]
MPYLTKFIPDAGHSVCIDLTGHSCPHRLKTYGKQLYSNCCDSPCKKKPADGDLKHSILLKAVKVFGWTEREFFVEEFESAIILFTTLAF